MENKEFLQSEEWRKFQENFGRKTFHIEHEGFWANIIEHKLPIIGKYLYIPKGPIFELDYSDSPPAGGSFGMTEVIDLAKKEKDGWIRIDIENKKDIDLIKKNTDYKITKAPHDMQPKENFVIDIVKSEEELLNEMKPKTRYNINLAQKKGVKIVAGNNYVDEFLRLVSATAKRKGIKFHPENYYRRMIESIKSDMLSLYCAEYNNKIIAANLVVFYNNAAVYLHGATDDEYRNVMAPYLLQWQAILDAKQKGCKFYDFGGVKAEISNFQFPASPKLQRGEPISNKNPNSNDQNTKYKIQDTKYNSWAGITKFKLGFSQATKPIEFLGSYDIIISPIRYWMYRSLQKLKSIF